MRLNCASQLPASLPSMPPKPSKLRVLWLDNLRPQLVAADTHMGAPRNSVMLKVPGAHPEKAVQRTAIYQGSGYQYGVRTPF